MDITGRAGRVESLDVFATCPLSDRVPSRGDDCAGSVGFEFSLGKEQGEFAEEVGVRAKEAGDLRVDEVDGAVHHLVPGQMLQNVIAGRGGGGSCLWRTVRNSL